MTSRALRPQAARQHPTPMNSALVSPTAWRASSWPLRLHLHRRRVLVILIMAHKLPPQLSSTSAAPTSPPQLRHHHPQPRRAILLFARPAGKPSPSPPFSTASDWRSPSTSLACGPPRRSLLAARLLRRRHHHRRSLALIAYGSTIRHWRPRHHITIVLLVLAIAGFGYALYNSVQWAGSRIGPLLEQLENKAQPEKSPGTRMMHPRACEENARHLRNTVLPRRRPLLRRLFT